MMDAKALAKSKRAHSLHHGKNHRIPKSKTQSAATTTTTTDAATGNKKVRDNWDRYVEESDDLYSEADRYAAVALPKSQGADYGHLIAQAQSNSQSYSDTLLSLDENFHPSIGPMLSVRGESILSWIEDDNFVLGDETAAGPEASFLSLNLHTLAEQLAKVDVSERLFIEADLLPPELSGPGSKASSTRESDQMQRSESKETSSTVSVELSFQDISEKNKAVNQNTAVISSVSTSHGNSDPISFDQGPNILNQVKGDFNSNQDGHSNQSRALPSPTQFNVSSVAEPISRVRTFKAAAAEAELDLLLNSFGETNLLDSSGLTSNPSPALEDDFPTAAPQLTRNAPDSSVTTSSAANLDDALDDLLEKTSNLLNPSGMHRPGEVKPAPSETQASFSSEFNPKSKVLDDFDSWLDTI